MELYDWADTEASRRRRRGIKDVTWVPKDILRRGSVRRGAEVTIKVADDHFSDEGDLALFGLVLSEFLSLYATINAFVHLVVESVPSGKSVDPGGRRIIKKATLIASDPSVTPFQLWQTI